MAQQYDNTYGDFPGQYEDPNNTIDNTYGDWAGMGEGVPSFQSQTTGIDPAVQAYLNKILAQNNPQMIQPGLKTSLDPGEMVQGMVAGAPGSKIGDILSGIGAGAGAVSQNEKINRLIKGNYTQDYDKMMIEAQAGRDTDESNSLKHLAQTGYLQGTSGMTMNPGQFSPYAAGMTPKISDAQRQGAAGLEGQLVKRLQPGGYTMPHDLNSYANPGTLENITGYGGALADLMGGMSPGGAQASGGGVNWGKVGSDVIGGVKKIGGFLGGLFGGGNSDQGNI